MSFNGRKIASEAINCGSNPHAPTNFKYAEQRTRKRRPVLTQCSEMYCEREGNMKAILALILLAILVTAGCRLSEDILAKRFESKVTAASGAIFSADERKFFCSGTEIGHTADGDGIFLTARHCVADPETNELHKHMVLSFSDNEGGPFYDAVPIYISLDDDLALLAVRNGANIPEVRIRDSRRLLNGDPIFNVSFPKGTGKQEFHGQYMRSDFPYHPREFDNYPYWAHSMPVNMTIAHGSSGSGVFSKRERALIGVAVGTFEEGTYNIAEPSDRVIDFLNDLKDNTVDKFVAANPQQESRFF
jgi:S1-C subfamily serine protease